MNQQATQQPAAGNRFAAAANDLDSVIAQTESRRKGLFGAAASMLGVPQNKLCDLLRNIWGTSKGQPPLTDQEMWQGIAMIGRYELDPLAREIYVSRSSKGLITVLGIDGWVKILDRTDHYDGFDVEFLHDAEGKLEWVETVIYSTKRTHPTRYRAFWKEYAKVGGFVSQQMPSHMLRIFSLRHAARLFTSVGGNVVTEEEAAMMMRSEPVTAAASQPSGPVTMDDLIGGGGAAELAEDPHPEPPPGPRESPGTEEAESPRQQHADPIWVHDSGFEQPMLRQRQTAALGKDPVRVNVAFDDRDNVLAVFSLADGRAARAWVANEPSGTASGIEHRWMRTEEPEPDTEPPPEPEQIDPELQAKIADAFSGCVSVHQVDTAEKAWLSDGTLSDPERDSVRDAAETQRNLIRSEREKTNPA